MNERTNSVLRIKFQQQESLGENMHSKMMDLS